MQFFPQTAIFGINRVASRNISKIKQIFTSVPQTIKEEYVQENYVIRNFPFAH